jgi:hypothetical protein
VPALSTSAAAAAAAAPRHSSSRPDKGMPRRGCMACTSIKACAQRSWQAEATPANVASSQLGVARLFVQRKSDQFAALTDDLSLLKAKKSGNGGDFSCLASSCLSDWSRCHADDAADRPKRLNM